MSTSRDVAPGVAVAVPLWRPSRPYVRELLESLAAQTRPPDELVLADQEHPSCRWAAQMAESLGLPCTLVDTSEVVGMAANWNAAVRSTSREWVLLAHQDDALLPHSLELLEAAHGDAASGVVQVSGHEIRVDETGEIIRAMPRTNHRGFIFLDRFLYELDYDDLAYLMLRNGQVFGEPSSMLFSRDAFRRSGGFDESMIHSVDIDFILRMASLGASRYVGAPVVRRRVHRSQATVANIRSGVTIAERKMLTDRYLLSIPAGKRRTAVRSGLAARYVFDALRAGRNGRVDSAVTGAGQVVRLRPSPLRLVRQAVEVSVHTNPDAALARRRRTAVLSSVSPAAFVPVDEGS